MASVVVLGALDTKGREVEFLARLIGARGHQTLTVDTGVLGTPLFRADISRQEVAEAGGYSLDELIREADRGSAVTAVTKGAVRLVEDLHAARRVDAIVAMGGGAGTTVGTAAMRVLPLGIPKVMVSTLASGDVRGFVGVKDIVMIPAIVDISGLNRISRGVFARAAGAVCGMLDAAPGAEESSDARLMTASMFGNTTPCVERARTVLEAQGYELLVFHATGSGGQTMESLIEAGQISGVLDVTTTEWADELVGGVMSAGPHRLEAAARTGTPAVIAPGCLDMVNFWEPEALPAHLRGRRLYQHNAKQTLVRTTPEENVQLGEIIADKLNASVGAGRRLPAASRRVGDLRRREAVPLARGGPRPVRYVEVASPAGHPMPRDGLPHQRRAFRRGHGPAPARHVLREMRSRAFYRSVHDLRSPQGMKFPWIECADTCRRLDNTKVHEAHEGHEVYFSCSSWPSCAFVHPAVSACSYF